MNLKQMAAAKAVKWTGEIRDIVGIPTSRSTEQLARGVGIPLTGLDRHPKLDLTIDGADEVDLALNLIKGGGGALLHEKIVARASLREIIIVDGSKLVEVLGRHFALPVEVIPFGWGTYEDSLRALGCEPMLRMRGGEPILTDEGNYIVDCRFECIDDPGALERELNVIPGVVENGLFVGLASLVIVASEHGVRELRL
jgi:ribose 5-phosphate isomerase A